MYIKCVIGFLCVYLFYKLLNICDFISPTCLVGKSLLIIKIDGRIKGNGLTWSFGNSLVINKLGLVQ